jgi:hypothetical protein
MPLVVYAVRLLERGDDERAIANHARAPGLRASSVEQSDPELKSVFLHATDQCMKGDAGAAGASR